jgi:hypothetical protein
MNNSKLGLQDKSKLRMKASLWNKGMKVKETKLLFSLKLVLTGVSSSVLDLPY